nr:MAG: hypothetical protein [Microvirus sp.]QXN72835.1 MAG: hypothetical protein [Microvirus sp.]
MFWLSVAMRVLETFRSTPSWPDVPPDLARAVRLLAAAVAAAMLLLAAGQPELEEVARELLCGSWSNNLELLPRP